VDYTACGIRLVIFSRGLTYWVACQMASQPCSLSVIRSDGVIGCGLQKLSPSVNWMTVVPNIIMFCSDFNGIAIVQFYRRCLNILFWTVMTFITILMLTNLTSKRCWLLNRKAGHPVVVIRCCHPQNGWCYGWRYRRATNAGGVWWPSDKGGGQAADIKRDVGS